jgi:hypothetical protein
MRTENPLLQEAKDRVAKKHGLHSTMDANVWNRANHIADEVSEEYASIRNKELMEALKSVMGMWQIANQAHYERNTYAVNKFKELIYEIENKKVCE